MQRGPQFYILVAIAIVFAILFELCYLLLIEELRYSDVFYIITRLGIVYTATIFFVNWFDSVVAKYNLMRFFPGVVNVGGRWEGWKLNELSVDGEWKPICIEFRQGFFVHAEEIGEGNRKETVNSSISISAVSFSNNQDQTLVLWNYKTDRSASRGSAEQDHNGTFILGMNNFDKIRMEGKYYADIQRYKLEKNSGVKINGGRGTYGEVHLAKSKERPCRSLNFNEKHWAMAKPTKKNRILEIKEKFVEI